MSSQHKGIVTQIIGPVLDIRFAEGELPALRNAITGAGHHRRGCSAHRR